MESTNFIGRHGEQLGIGISAIMALLFVYLTLPSIVATLSPEIGEQLWKSPISVRQGISIIAGIIFISFLFATMGRVRASRMTGHSVIPAWLVALTFGSISTIAIALITLVGFGIGQSAMLSLGVESSVAILVGFLVAMLVLWVMK